MRGIWLLFLWLAVAPVHGADAGKQQANADKPQADTDKQQANAGEPSLQLLEFLGSWDNGHGEWVDPTEFADDSFEQLVSTKGTRHDK